MVVQLELRRILTLIFVLLILLLSHPGGALATDTGNPLTPAGIRGVSFRPTLRVTLDDVAGSVSGSVTTQLDGVTVEGLTVTATPVDDTTLEPFQSGAATATTDANGDFTVFFLVPGDYEITVETPEGLTADPVTVTVGASEDVTGVALEIVES